MFNQATAKARLGLTDASKDTLVDLSLATAQAIAERYCDRFFDEKDETENIVPLNGNSIKVHRYPLTSVTGMTLAHGTQSIDTSSYHMDKPAGVIYLDGGVYSHEVDVRYKGGYAILPSDLEMALWLVFDAVWAATPGAGRSASAGGAVGATGNIKSISTPDTGTIQYFDPSSSSSSSVVGAASSFLTGDAMSLLEPYRRRDA